MHSFPKTPSIFFGGAFNPPTRSHESVVQHLLKTYPTHKIVLLPSASDNPEAKTLAPFDERVRWLKLMFKDEHRVIVSDYMSHMPSHTKGRLYHMLHALPEDATFCIGSDQATNITTWYEWQTVVSKVKFLVIERNGNSIPEEIAALFGNLIISTPDSILKDSSTELRALLRDNQDASHILPKQLAGDVESIRVHFTS